MTRKNVIHETKFTKSEWFVWTTKSYSSPVWSGEQLCKPRNGPCKVHKKKLNDDNCAKNYKKIINKNEA